MFRINTIAIKSKLLICRKQNTKSFFTCKDNKVSSKNYILTRELVKKKKTRWSTKCLQDFGIEEGRTETASRSGGGWLLGPSRSLYTTWRKRPCLRRLHHCLAPGRPMGAHPKPNPIQNLTIYLYQFLSLFLRQTILLCCARKCLTLPVRGVLVVYLGRKYLRGSCLLHIALETVTCTLRLCSAHETTLFGRSPSPMIQDTPASRKWDPGQDGWLGEW